MESTGVYWKPIYNVFEDYIRNIWIVNARHIKNVPGHKTDKNDSEWICQLLMAGLLKPSFIPPREQRELRDLTRYRRKLIETVSANKNRIIRTLEDGNVKLSSVLSDTSGSTATKLIEMLCDGRTLTLADIEAVRHKRCHHSAEEMLEACTGYMNSHKIYMLQKIRSCNRRLTEEIAEMDRHIKESSLPTKMSLQG
jgi:Transposase and inactivated derivatives